MGKASLPLTLNLLCHATSYEAPALSAGMDRPCLLLRVGGAGSVLWLTLHLFRPSPIRVRSLHGFLCKDAAKVLSGILVSLPLAQDLAEVPPLRLAIAFRPLDLRGAEVPDAFEEVDVVRPERGFPAGLSATPYTEDDMAVLGTFPVVSVAILISKVSIILDAKVAVMEGSAISLDCSDSPLDQHEALGSNRLPFHVEEFHCPKTPFNVDLFHVIHFKVTTPLLRS